MCVCVRDGGGALDFGMRSSWKVTFSNVGVPVMLVYWSQHLTDA